MTRDELRFEVERRLAILRAVSDEWSEHEGRAAELARVTPRLTFVDALDRQIAKALRGERP